MTRRTKIVTRIAAGLASVALILFIAAIIVLRTERFHNYVREKIISVAADSTGGTVEMKTFAFDWRGLTATVTGFVIHGTEPPGAAPLFEAPSIVLRLKLLAGLKKTVDLEYLGVDRPGVNVMVFPNGQTNVPTPKVARKPGDKSALETVVDLAIHKVDIRQGAIQFLQQKTAFSARGQDLKIELGFVPLANRYRGGVSMSRLDLVSGSRPPLTAKVTIPVELEKDKIQVTNAKIETPESSFILTCALEHLASPEISGQLSARVALAELARSADLPIHPTRGRGPQSLDALVAVQANQIVNASVTLGRTHLEASGDPSKRADVHASLSLDEIGPLLELTGLPSGMVQLAASVRVDPKTISLSDLKVAAFGGELTANAQVEDLSTFTVKGRVRGFTIQNLTEALVSKRIGYAGSISGTLDARGTFKAPDAEARLSITPSGSGIPLSGQLNASYSAAKNLVSLTNSQLKLPNTHIELTGELGRQVQIQATSRNLSDFLPVMDEMPVTLNGGTGSVTADIRGPLTAPQISGHVSLSAFAISQRLFDQFAADFSASSSGANVQNGSLNRNGSETQFSGSIGLHDWRAEPRDPLTVNATIRSGDLADILALAGQSNLRAKGLLTADVRIAGTVGNPQGSAQLSVVNGTAYGEPFDRLQAVVDLSDQLVDLKSAQLAAGPARIDIHGSFHHPRDSFETGQIQLHLASSQIQLGQFATLQEQRPGLAGAINLNADVSGELRQTKDKLEFVPSAVNADLKAAGIHDRGQNYGDLTATARTSGSDVTSRVDSDFAGSTIQITGRTRLAPNYPTTADVMIGALQIEKAVAVIKPPYEVPAKGTLSVKAHVTGTLDDPRANLTFNLTKGTVYDESIDRMDGAIDYTNQLVTVSSLQAIGPAGRVDLDGSLSHAPSDFLTGKVELHLAAHNLDLRRLQNIQKTKPGLAGALRLTADVSADLRKENGEQQVLPSRFDASGGATGITWNGQSLGDVTFQGQTKGSVVSVKLDSNFAKSSIHGTGDLHLQGDYPVDGKITFANLTYAGIQGFLESQPEARPAFDALVEGQVTIAGSAKQPKNLKGDLQLANVELSGTPTRGSARNKKTVALQNQGPIVAHLERSVIRVESARITGKSTDISIGGTVALDKSDPLDLTMSAHTDLSVLKDFSQDIYSSGSVDLSSSVRGTLSQPRVNGKFELKDASLQLADWPNGISKANGVIQLNGTNATIGKLTAESGGGKVTITGFFGFTGSTFTYNLRANANDVRTRYAGASVIATANVNLSGTSDRSILGGSVSIEQVGYNQQSDFGSILSGAAAPPETPSDSEGMLANTRLNIRIQTAPDVRFQTNLAQELEASANLHLLGTLANPGMVGRIDITGGTLIFFGNKYAVNRGSVAFYDALKIEPILDIDLETSVKSVDVTLGVSGPIENLKLTYRSDPPLKFEDIVALLATGRTPPDATIAAQQPATPDQSVTQMGESAILGQAVANPVANRLSRVFGVSQLKIDPSFNSGSALPTARVTLQQQVTPTLTFTYTQDLTQTNSQIIRVEWAMTPRFSAVATRDENGIFGVDFFYKKQFK